MWAGRVGGRGERADWGKGGVQRSKLSSITLDRGVRPGRWGGGRTGEGLGAMGQPHPTQGRVG